MVSIIIHASYSDERLIQEFLNELFASDVSIMRKRGRFIINAPRALTESQISRLQRTVRVEHFDQGG
ncbi:uncharacterized protein VDAG_08207 [Verticillium dahliae VdLs.17]|uniref:Uncharacterized protein n=1 Tax=Verticillium dahliae (strain VdLs.17 / ATCC MYA-4575 / FGSC 10137) TaxID=498257 RepID=G2XDH5_VERDV|nr:uncharacterized protein VDAG_08207 [Verticillium dahliae VdLs.17]EGY17043.1 hypothetical protein VDAG_08207 [Verticillium dahliae VdLs.17]